MNQQVSGKHFSWIYFYNVWGFTDPDIGIKYGFPVDHREICKPAGRDCFLYVQLLELIKRVVPIDT